MYGLLCTTRVLVLAIGVLGGRGCAETRAPAISRPMPAQSSAVQTHAALLPTIRPARGAGLVVGIRVPFD